MILLDANLLIYSHVGSFRQHAQAKDWLDARLATGGRVGMPWASLLAFLRIVTNPRIFERPEPMSDAWRQVEDWLDSEAVWIPQATDSHRKVVGSFLAA
ncbi:MAG TPA: TA system VapC family ribonuclease toxin, partial [Casimicrobiaceae bacterium]